MVQNGWTTQTGSLLPLATLFGLEWFVITMEKLQKCIDLRKKYHRKFNLHLIPEIFEIILSAEHYRLNGVYLILRLLQNGLNSSILFLDYFESLISIFYYVRDLATNLISGTIPVEITNITQMQNLYRIIPHIDQIHLCSLRRLSLNQLSGTLYTDFGKFTNATSL